VWRAFLPQAFVVVRLGSLAPADVCFVLALLRQRRLVIGVRSHHSAILWFAGPMPVAATFRSRLVAREPLYGAWSVIPSPLSVRLLAAAGLDYVVIDLQRIWAACAAAGKPVGVHASEGTTARRYREAGCTLITAADDASAIARNAAAQLTLART